MTNYNEITLLDLILNTLENESINDGRASSIVMIVPVSLVIDVVP